MDFHALDPAFTQSARARANFRLAVAISATFVALLWAIQLAHWALDVDPGYLGVRPRSLAGLPGILFAPMLHAGFPHLLANSAPLIVLGTAMLHLYPRSSRTVLPAIYVLPGAAVWLFARDGVHLGASGLVYGLVAYVLVAGLLRRDTRAIAASLLSCFMYGQLVWGLLPIESGTSWETHLAAAVIGVLLALHLRHLDQPPRRRYTWEEEPLEPEPSETHEQPTAGEAPLEPKASDAHEEPTPEVPPLEDADVRRER